LENKSALSTTLPLHTKIGQQALEIDFLERAHFKSGLLSAGK